VYQLMEAVKGRGVGVSCGGSVVHAKEVKFPIIFTVLYMRTTTFFKLTQFWHFLQSPVLMRLSLSLWTRTECVAISVLSEL